MSCVFATTLDTINILLSRTVVSPTFVDMRRRRPLDDPGGQVQAAVDALVHAVRGRLSKGSVGGAAPDRQVEGFVSRRGCRPPEYVRNCVGSRLFRGVRVDVGVPGVVRLLDRVVVVVHGCRGDKVILRLRRAVHHQH